MGKDEDFLRESDAEQKPGYQVHKPGEKNTRLKVTRNQLRYYYGLCRELGFPNELATQQQVHTFNTYRKLDDRIQELLLMKSFRKEFDKNRFRARSIFWVLSHAIERESKELLEIKESSWLAQIDIDKVDFTIKDQFRVYFRNAKGGVAGKAKKLIRRVLRKLKKQR
jgi:hypothetical protein